MNELKTNLYFRLTTFDMLDGLFGYIVGQNTLINNNCWSRTATVLINRYWTFPYSKKVKQLWSRILIPGLALTWFKSRAWIVDSSPHYIFFLLWLARILKYWLTLVANDFQLPWEKTFGFPALFLRVWSRPVGNPGSGQRLTHHPSSSSGGIRQRQNGHISRERVWQDLGDQLTWIRICLLG